MLAIAAAFLFTAACLFVTACLFAATFVVVPSVALILTRAVVVHPADVHGRNLENLEVFHHLPRAGRRRLTVSLVSILREARTLGRRRILRGGGGCCGRGGGVACIERSQRIDRPSLYLTHPGEWTSRL